MGCVCVWVCAMVFTVQSLALSLSPSPAHLFWYFLLTHLVWKHPDKLKTNYMSILCINNGRSVVIVIRSLFIWGINVQFVPLCMLPRSEFCSFSFSHFRSFWMRLAVYPSLRPKTLLYCQWWMKQAPLLLNRQKKWIHRMHHIFAFAPSHTHLYTFTCDHTFICELQL